MKERISSLSEVFPEGSVYFYGYPAGQESGFFNECPPETEEIVAMRPAVCAGDRIQIATFAKTVSDDVLQLLRDEFGVPLLRNDQILKFPSTIDTSLRGSARNDQIKRALTTMSPDGKLIMAQPYINDELRRNYLIDPAVTVWANDKKNIREFVPEQYRVPELARVENGEEFMNEDAARFRYPCVVKVSASSAGDGVRICKSQPEFKAVQQEFKQNPSTILVLQFIENTSEIGIQFAVHRDTQKPFEFVGHSQLVKGGNVIRRNPDEIVERIFKVMEEEILPKLQEKGWFGIGGVDVLVDADGNFFFSDFNCRMTASTALTMESNSGILGDRSILTFNGEFQGTLADFHGKLSSYARMGDAKQTLNIVALAPDEQTVRIHGGVLFDQNETMSENIRLLQQLGISANAF